MRQVHQVTWESEYVVATVDIEILKVCACGQRYTRTQWGMLDYVGTQVDDEMSLELRLCTCHSTLAIVIGKVEAA